MYGPLDHGVSVRGNLCVYCFFPSKDLHSFFLLLLQQTSINLVAEDNTDLLSYGFVGQKSNTGSHQANVKASAGQQSLWRESMS